MTNEKIALPDWASGVSINKIDKIDKIDNTNRINRIDRNDNIGIFTSMEKNTNSSSSSRPVGFSEENMLEVFSGVELLDFQENKGLVDSRPQLRNYSQELEETNWMEMPAITYAKLSLFHQKNKQLQISLHYRHPELYGNRLQQVLFAMTTNRKDFVDNLNRIWGPGTRDRAIYRMTYLRMKEGEILCAGKGRRANSRTANKQKMAPLYVESVAFVDRSNDMIRITTMHHGFRWSWYISEEEFTRDDCQAGRPFVTKEYRRNEQYGY